MRLLAIILFLLPGLALAQTAEEARDRGILQAFIEDNLSAAGREVRIDGFAGALSSRATLDRLSIADDDGVWLVLEGATLDWTRSAMLRGRLEINELSADKLILPRLPKTAADAPKPEAGGFVFALPELPVSIDLTQLRIGRAEFGAPVLGEAVVLKLDGSASLAGGAGKVALAIDRLDGPAGKISVAGTYANATQALELALEFREAPGGIAAGLLDLPGEPAVDLVLDGRGTLDDFNASLTLATDGTERIGGTVTLGALPVVGDETPDRRFGADIQGDIAPLLQADYQEFVGERVTLDVAGILRGDGRLELERLDVQTGSVMLTGALVLGPDKWPEMIAVSGQIASPTGGEVLLAIPGPKTWIRQVDLTVGFDAAAGNGWQAETVVTGLRRNDLSVGRAALAGSGELERGDGAAIGQVAGGLELDIAGITLIDAALAEAVGTAIAGNVNFGYTEAAPLLLDFFGLSSGDVKLSGNAVVSGFEAGGSPLIDGEVTLETGDLRRFAAISGMDLTGAGNLTLAGRIEPLGGAFDLTLAGATRDLGIGNAFLDPLITGAGTIDAAVRRDATGLAADRLVIVTPTTDLSLAGTLATGAADLRLSLAIADAAVVDPALAGPASVTGTAVQEGETWTISAQLAGPGGTSAVIDGTVGIGEAGLGAVNGIAEVSVDSLAPYSGIAGRTLGGGLQVTLAGAGDAVAGTGEATVTGQASDLVLGIETADKLLAGVASLTVDLARDAAGLLTLRSGVFDTPQGSATVSGTLGADGARMDFDVTLSDAAIYEPRLSGPASARGTINQDGNDWQLAATLAAPGGASGGVQAAVTITDGVPGMAAVNATVSADSIVPYSSLAGRALAGAAALKIAATGDLRDLSGRAEISGTTNDLAIGADLADRLLAGTTNLKLSVARTADGTISFTDSTLANPQISAELAGNVGGTDAALVFDAVLSEIALVIPELSGPASARGALTRSGDSYAVKAGLTGPGETSGTVDGTITLIDSVPGAVSGTAQIGVARLGAFSVLAGRDLGGALALDVTASGDLRDLTGQVTVTLNGQDLKVGIDAADRLLQGESVAKLSAARDAEGRIAIESGTIETAVANARVAGSLGGDGARLVFDAGVTDMSVLADRLSGAANLNGLVTQTDRTWHTQASLSAPGGVAASVDSSVEMTDAGPGAVTLMLDLTADDLGPYSRLVGQQLGGGLTLTAEVAGDLATLTGSAEVDATTASLRTGIDAADKLLTGSGTLSLSVERKTDGTLVFRRANARTGQLTAELTGRYGKAAGSAVTFDLRLANLGVFAPGFNGPATAQGTARSEGSDLRVYTALTGPGGVSARVAGLINPTTLTGALGITGSAPLAIANSFIEPNIVNGTATFDLSLNGPLELASLSGTLRTEGASLTLPSVPLRLTGIRADVSLSGGRAQITADAAVSSGGRLDAAGSITLSAPFVADLAVQVRDVRAVDPGLYETFVNGHVELAGPLSGGAAITGGLTLGKTEVRIPDGGGLTAVNMAGVIHEHEPNRVLRTRIRAGLIKTGNGGSPGAAYPLDIRVSAPNRIFIRGRGLDAELGGSILLSGTTSDVITQGKFELIRGRLDILGERLVLSEGSVRMQGDFDPFVRFVATTTSGDVSIRILIEGFASAPELSITSVPDLPEEEVLARLIFKRGLGEISAVQAVQLGLAIRTLAGGGGDGIMGRLRKSFGLDDLDVTTNDAGNAELRLGTYVTDNIYTGVTVDSEGRSEVNLNLQIHPNVTARGSVSSDGETGIGLFFERDY